MANTTVSVACLSQSNVYPSLIEIIWESIVMVNRMIRFAQRLSREEDVELILPIVLSVHRTTAPLSLMLRGALLALVLLFLIPTGCAPHRESARRPDKQGINASAVYVLENSSSTGGSLKLAMKQVSHPDALVVLRMDQPAEALLATLREIQNLSNHPIVAMTEYDGWFWFATDVARESDTKTIRTLIKGYAIKKGGRSVFSWSVW